jgi:aldose 1-epimerase
MEGTSVSTEGLGDPTQRLQGAPSLALGYHSVDGEEGYPGAVDVEVEFTLVRANALRIRLPSSTDRRTVVNLTSHAFFNFGRGRVR